MYSPRGHILSGNFHQAKSLQKEKNIYIWNVSKGWRAHSKARTQVDRFLSFLFAATKKKKWYFSSPSLSLILKTIKLWFTRLLLLYDFVIVDALQV